MKKYKFAIIGCGRISYKHIEAIVYNSLEAELVSVCDPITDIAQKRMKEYCDIVALNVTVYADYREMLAKENIDIVTIATESGLHAEISIYCMGKGKHVIVEKPMALSIKDADEMISCAEKNNVVLSVCHQNRFNEPIQKLHDAIIKGRFGKIYSGTARVLWNRDDDYYRQAPWRGTWEMDGGTLMNQCIHNIDLLLWSMGCEVDTVFSMCSTFKHCIEGEDFGSILIRFKNGSIGIVEGSVCVFPKNLEETLSIFGDKGTVCIGGIAVNQTETWRFDDDIDSESEILNQQKINPDTVYGHGHSCFFKNVIDSIHSGKKPLVCGHEGRKSVELVLAAYKSQLTGQPIKLPLDKFATIDMKRDVK